MAVNEGWGRRLRDAKRAYEHRHDTRLSYEEIGVRVARLVGRDRAFTPTAARAWFTPGQEPDGFATARAIAEVLEADAAALMLGDDYTLNAVGDLVPNALPPGVTPVTPQPYTPRDAFDQLREQREADEKPAKKTNGSKGRGGGRA